MEFNCNIRTFGAIEMSEEEIKVTVLDSLCPNCSIRLGEHTKKEAKKCSEILFIYYKGLELFAK